MDELAIKILGGLIRAGTAALGGYLVQKGLDDGGLLQTIGGSATILATGAWSWVQKIRAQKKLKAAVAAPAGKAQ